MIIAFLSPGTKSTSQGKNTLSNVSNDPESKPFPSNGNKDSTVAPNIPLPKRGMGPKVFHHSTGSTLPEDMRNRVGHNMKEALNIELEEKARIPTQTRAETPLHGRVPPAPEELPGKTQSLSK